MFKLTRHILALFLLSMPLGAVAEDEAVEEIPADHVTERDRLWANFTRETAVVGNGNLRLAVQTLLINKSVEDNRPDMTGYPFDDHEKALAIAGTPDRVKSVEAFRFDVNGAYGLGSTAEVGFNIPIYAQKIAYEGDTPTDNTENIGDMVVHAKFRRMLSANTAMGGGLEITIPTGCERHRLGTGDLAFTPFVNIRHNFGRIAVGGHLGGYLSEGSTEDTFNYSAFMIARASEKVALRLEINGRYFKYLDFESLENESTRHVNDVSLWPGLDINVSDRITLRPQGMVHLTDDAWNWGIGIGAFIDLDLLALF